MPRKFLSARIPASAPLTSSTGAGDVNEIQVQGFKGGVVNRRRQAVPDRIANHRAKLRTAVDRSHCLGISVGLMVCDFFNVFMREDVWCEPVVDRGRHPGWNRLS